MFKFKKVNKAKKFEVSYVTDNNYKKVLNPKAYHTLNLIFKYANEDIETYHSCDMGIWDKATYSDVHVKCLTKLEEIKESISHSNYSEQEKAILSKVCEEEIMGIIPF